MASHREVGFTKPVRRKGRKFLSRAERKWLLPHGDRNVNKSLDDLFGSLDKKAKRGTL